MTAVVCVIPTHKRTDFLEASLASVAGQTLAPSRVVVVSDVPDAEAKHLCARLDTESALSIEFVESAPGKNGASSSRNIGAAAAGDADLIAFLDDDDLWQPDYLARAVRLSPGVDLVITWIDEFGDGHERSGPRMRPGLRAQDVAAINPGATGSNMLVSKRLFDRIGGFDAGLQVKNDTDFLYRALRAGASYEIVEEPLVLQRKHSSGQLTARTEKRARGTEIYIDKHKSSLTAEDVRIMRQQVERIRMYAGDSLFKRFAHMLRMMRYYTVRDFMRVLKRGKDKTHARVASFE